MQGYAVYEIKTKFRTMTVRYSVHAEITPPLTFVEAIVKEIVCDGFGELHGRVGMAVDPYKAAERILANHYEHAKMVEAHYEWRPRIRY